MSKKKRLSQKEAKQLFQGDGGLVTESCPTLCNPMDCKHTRLPCPSPTPGVYSDSCPESVMPSNHLILCRPLLLLPLIFPSIRVFSNESSLRIRWPKYWVSASTSVLPMNTQNWSPLEWTVRRSNQSILKEISPGCSLEGLMLNWNSNTLATWCEELTHWKRAWCWEILKKKGEGDDKGWDGWMASPTQWTWIWVDSGSWWWTGRPGMLRFMG